MGDGRQFVSERMRFRINRGRFYSMIFSPFVFALLATITSAAIIGGIFNKNEPIISRIVRKGNGPGEIFSIRKLAGDVVKNGCSNLFPGERIIQISAPTATQTIPSLHLSDTLIRRQPTWHHCIPDDPSSLPQTTTRPFAKLSSYSVFALRNLHTEKKTKENIAGRIQFRDPTQHTEST